MVGVLDADQANLVAGLAGPLLFVWQAPFLGLGISFGLAQLPLQCSEVGPLTFVGDDIPLT
eukprot:6382696-Amphidinium_carterae.1